MPGPSSPPRTRAANRFNRPSRACHQLFSSSPRKSRDHGRALATAPSTEMVWPTQMLDQSTPGCALGRPRGSTSQAVSCAIGAAGQRSIAEPHNIIWKRVLVPQLIERGASSARPLARSGSIGDQHHLPQRRCDAPGRWQNLLPWPACARYYSCEPSSVILGSIVSSRVWRAASPSISKAKLTTTSARAMSLRRLIVKPFRAIPPSWPRGIHHRRHHRLYGRIEGECYFRGIAGDVFAVRNSGAVAGVEVPSTIARIHDRRHRPWCAAIPEHFASGMSVGIAYYWTRRATRKLCNWRWSSGAVFGGEISTRTTLSRQRRLEAHAVDVSAIF